MPAVPADASNATHASGPGHLPALDGVRGLAVLVVFLYHYGGGAHTALPPVRWAGLLLQLGWGGVSLFFVLSGFLITGILWRSKYQARRWRTFLIRRALRIFPLYYFALALVLLSLLRNHTFAAAWPALLSYALYLQNLGFPAYLEPYTRLQLGHFWSLAVEEQFYLLWPLLLWSMPTTQRARQLCGLVLVLSLAFRAWVWFAPSPFFLEAMPARAGELAIGAWLALRLLEHPHALAGLRRWVWPAIAAGLAGAFACGWIGGNLELHHAPMFLGGLLLLPLAAAGVIVGALTGGVSQRLLSTAPLQYLGRLSYGIYVYHLLFGKLYIEWTALLLPRGSHLQQLSLLFVVASVCTLAIAELSFRLLEKPMLRWKDRLAGASPRAV